VSKYVKYEKGTVKPENLKKEPKFKMTESSLANLKPKWDNDHMKKMAAKSLEKRRANRDAREKMKETVGILKYLSDGVMSEMPSGLTVMQIMMVRAIQDGDPAEAAKLAATIAEYQQPKLQRTENINTNINMEDLTDDELALQLAKINGTITENIKDIEGEVVND
jgi:hypothetical protein|tara:strand:- start:2201 stop:2695 length:495 start_codon:yes stop_codon:yes gene_type:complete